MRVVFIGTVESSKVALEELLKEKTLEIEGVFTIINNTFNSDCVDLTSICLKNNLKIYDIFGNINSDDNIEKIKKMNPDIIFVIGFSQIIKQEIIEIPKLGCIGFHPTLLPKYRGRAVIPWQILNREKEGGITFFKIDNGTDTGDILYQTKFNIATNESATSMYEKILKALALGIKPLLRMINNKKLNGLKQNNSLATYCAIRSKEDGKINWNSSAEDIDCLIRATTKPYPGAYSYHKGEKIIIWESEVVEDNWLGVAGQRVEIVKNIGVKVKTGKGLILIKKVQYKNEELRADEVFKISGKKFENY